MKTYIHKLTVCLLFLLVPSGCSDESPTAQQPVESVSQVTFIEIGSDHCEPCKLMRPIMDSLARKYGAEQLTVLFYDVYKNKAEAEPYHIRVMPTQVFLDRDGVEFHRHEGFYPEAEIDSLLIGRGLKILTGG
ncbi:MAG: thioredoxin family protein [Bacteroidetes bacterium]|nr:thioredoxin family protein [Bacteroidota bacterium]